jgi:hypothetical protein
MVSLNGGYYRNWGANFNTTDNTLVGPGDYSPYCVMAPSDSRLPGGGGYQLCGLYDISVAKFSANQSVIAPSADFGKQINHNDFFNVSTTARFAGGIRLGGGFDIGRSVTDNCFVVNSPEQLEYNTTSTLGAAGSAYGTPTAVTYCHVVIPWIANLQVKVNGSVPLPYGFSMSANYQNIAGPQVTASWNAPNSLIAPTLGRNLAACGTKTVCTATANVPLIVPGTDYLPRRNQTDLRFSRPIKLSSRIRFAPNLDIYNLFNANTVIAYNTQYGPQWLKPTNVLAGRLVEFGGRIDF